MSPATTHSTLVEETNFASQMALGDEQAHHREDRGDRENLARHRTHQIEHRIDDRVGDTLRPVGRQHVGLEPRVQYRQSHEEGAHEEHDPRAASTAPLGELLAEEAAEAGQDAEAGGAPGRAGPRGGGQCGHAARSLVSTRRMKTSSRPSRTRLLSMTVRSWSAARRVTPRWTVALTAGSTRSR